MFMFVVIELFNLFMLVFIELCKCWWWCNCWYSFFLSSLWYTFICLLACQGELAQDQECGEPPERNRGRLKEDQFTRRKRQQVSVTMTTVTLLSRTLH